MDIVIGDRWAPLMSDLVKQGRYADATAVVTEALNLLAQQERKFRELKQSINDAIEEGGDLGDDEIDAALAEAANEMRRRGYPD